MSRRQRINAEIAAELATEFGLAACENALALLDEVDLLDGKGHHAHAYTLSVFAAEELAKGWAAHLAKLWGDEEPSVWEEFADYLGGHHTDKIQSALFLERLPTLFGGQPDELASKIGAALSDDVYDRKNRGMYVDVEDRRVRTPADLAADSTARDFAKALRKSITIWAIIVQMSLRKDDFGERDT